ncbi:phosphoglycerate mutase [Fibrisoma montanum]|uniref:Phosphoglycerate mutase n=1 Tax=Fibrisoma montanum TaxID=2305895 RepID=A0A418MEX2_9BACT|nr:histidine phosphatase family protein [Fibrisoma montanum]RIV25359.1 phosphoglycerate mutase [Fibrisoma montanum]
MDIYLVRHTEVAVGRSVAYGQADVDLADNYLEQRDRLRSFLPTESSAVTFASPLSRCRKLALDLTEADEPVVFDDRLKEIHFGDWELIPWTDIGREVLDPWMADFVNVRTPNGENFQDVFDRVGAFWREQIVPLAESGTGQPVFVITHGGVIRALLCLFLGLSLQNAYRLHLDYGSVTKVTMNGLYYTIQYINR